MNFNGKEIDDVKFNNTNIQTIVFNGETAWTKWDDLVPPSAPEWTRPNVTYVNGGIYTLNGTDARTVIQNAINSKPVVTEGTENIIHTLTFNGIGEITETSISNNPYQNGKLPCLLSCNGRNIRLVFNGLLTMNINNESIRFSGLNTSASFWGDIDIASININSSEYTGGKAKYFSLVGNIVHNYIGITGINATKGASSSCRAFLWEYSRAMPINMDWDASITLNFSFVTGDNPTTVSWDLRFFTGTYHDSTLNFTLNETTTNTTQLLENRTYTLLGLFYNGNITLSKIGNPIGSFSFHSIVSEGLVTISQAATIIADSLNLNNFNAEIAPPSNSTLAVFNVKKFYNNLNKQIALHRTQTVPIRKIGKAVNFPYYLKGPESLKAFFLPTAVLENGETVSVQIKNFIKNEGE